MSGKILNYVRNSNKVEIEFENTKGVIEVISPWIINVFMPINYQDHFSWAVEDLKPVECSFEVVEYDGNIVITTNKLKVVICENFKVDFYDMDGKLLCQDYRGKREPFIRRGGDYEFDWDKDSFKDERPKRIEVVKALLGDEHFYGLGEKTGHLNKRGYFYEMWNTDNPSPHVESFKRLYKSIPFFITLMNDTSYGIFFDNTFKTYFDMGKENNRYFYFGSDDGNLDYYFIYGPRVSEVVEGHTYLTGRTPLPQMWTLGYQQSRWSYSPDKRVLEIAENFRKRDIPCDAIHLDIDYMDGYRVYTWDKNRFPNPKEMNKKLGEMGFKLVTIIDPGVKKDKGYGIYEEGLKKRYFATDKDGIPYVNEVWPGDSMYPDFTNPEVRKWWADNQRIMTDSGVSGIWNDMNEPASFRGELPGDVRFDNEGRGANHEEIHNIYGHLMSKATYEGIKKYTGKRPFVITRACYAGTQKYSTVWTGDNQSIWEHLRISVPQLLNLGLSGMAFCGTDVGGFSFDSTGELLSRWMQIGCFSPLFRNHSSTRTRDQEPWAFDDRTEEICRKYIKLRYKLLPYFYDILRNTEEKGLPVMRPLFMHYQNDANTYEINDEFLVGESILVAPVVEQGKTARMVYLPEGYWIDYWTGEVYWGEKYIIKEAPLDICPIFIKEGSIIPNYIEQSYIGEKKMDRLILDVYPGSGIYNHYIDDGESFDYRNGSYSLYEFRMDRNEKLTISINKLNDGYNDYKTFVFLINNVKPDGVKINGESVKFNKLNNRVEFKASAQNMIVEIL